MANTKSAVKRHRQSLKRKARNIKVKDAVKAAVKKARETVKAGDKNKAIEAVRVAQTLLDKAASKGVLHARNASRKIGRLTAASTRIA